jgi:hypothetical protein
MMKRKWTVCLCAVLWLTLQVDAAETTGQADFAILPYAVVYKMAQVAETEGISTNGKGLIIRFKSSLPGVRSKDISLFIDSKTGRVPLSLDVDGSCRLPVSDSLIKENPPIISNQPKGSMSLGGYINRRFAVPESRILPYRELMQPLRLATEAGTGIGRPPEVRSVEFLEALVIRVQDHGGSNVFIRAKSGVIGIPGGEYGVFPIPFRQQLMKENPDVVLPGRVAWFVGLPCGEMIEDSNHAAQVTAPKVADPGR